MKYFTVILSLTIILSFFESKRHSPFVLLEEQSVTNLFSILPKDEWTVPFTDQTELDSFCDQLYTAQLIRIQYNNVPLDYTLSGEAYFMENNFTMNIELMYNKNNFAGHGSICSGINSNVIVMKNESYNGYILLEREGNKKPNGWYDVMFRAAVMNLLSYEQAGKAAIDFVFANRESPQTYMLAIEVVQICTSLFQGLLSTTVQPFEKYFVTVLFHVKQDEVPYLHCGGFETNDQFSPPFIYYYITFQEKYDGRKLIIIKRQNGPVTYTTY